MSKSDLEKGFLRTWTIRYGMLQHPVREFQFDQENSRRWKFDFAWPFALVAVEIAGGTWISGGHSRGSGQDKDFEKLNAAALQGWHVLQFSTTMLRQQPIQCAELVAELIRRKGVR